MDALLLGIAIHDNHGRLGVVLALVSVELSKGLSTIISPHTYKKGEQLFEGQADKPLEATDDPTSTVDEKRTCYYACLLLYVSSHKPPSPSREHVT